MKPTTYLGTSENNMLPRDVKCQCHFIDKTYIGVYNWRGERSHSQVIKIEICDIYMYSTYVRIYPPGGRHRRLAAEWKIAGSSPAVELCFFFSLSLLFFFFPSPFPPFLFFSPPFPLSLPLPFSPSCSLCHFNAQAFF